MKRIALVLFVVALLVSATAALAHSSGFEISRSTVDGGGGLSSGGGFELQGTVGQSDAGVLSGGEFTLVGGFWGGSSWYRLHLPATFRNY